MRLDQALAEVCEKYSEKKALQICGEASLTFGELDSTATSYAMSLSQHHVKVGDRVGIVSGHDVHAIALFWGILRRGAIAVWLNEDAGIDALTSSLQNAEPALIVLNHSTKIKKGVLAELTKHRTIDLADLAAGSEPVTLENETDPDAVATIVYTSGSSGRPKGVSLTHRNLSCVARSVIEHMPITDEDSYLMVVPLHYVHGLMQLLVHTLAGATVYFYENFLFPRSVVSKLQETGVSGFSGVPFHFHTLVDRGGFLAAEFPELRWVTVTGGRLSSKRISQILDHQPGLEIHIAYGQTECAPRATALHPSKTRNKPDSVGSAIPNVKVELLDDSGCHVETGDVGEVVISGDNIMAGYWRDPRATAEVIDAEGRLHTGDLGYLDEDGDLFLVGRRTELIKSAGERIVPEELERLLLRHESVSDVVVVGAADELYGQRVVAHVVVAESDASTEEMSAVLKEHCLLSVPIERAPREFRYWKEFPRKANGKPDRTEIAANQSDKRSF